MERVHPDIFDDDDAIKYLRLEGGWSLDWVIDHFSLPAHKFGRKRIFYRPELDACALRMLGKDKEEQPKQRNVPERPLRLAGGRP